MSNHSQIDHEYVFLPWLRQGVGGRINEVDRLGEGTEEMTARATFDVELAINGEQAIRKEVKLIGPGDITGIDQRAIVKVAPVNGYYNFKPNYLPYIEFYEEDFPWRYSPAKSTGNHRLRPWLALLILREEEFERKNTAGSPLPSILIEDWTPLPNATQSWAWAHVHTYQEKNSHFGPTQFEKLVRDEPNLASSRIICPRKLLPNVQYHALLVPAFEQGRLAGLGADPEAYILQTDVQLHSWEAGIEHTFLPSHWPVYYQWNFKTGIKGDFEYLARLIQPRTLDAKIGRRMIDIQSPGHALHYPDNEGTVMMEGALRVPTVEETPFLEPSEDGGLSISESQAAFLNNLEELLNLNAPSTQAEANEEAYDDPFVLPPMYGQWHAQKEQVSWENLVSSPEPHWHDKLNLDPRHRATAGVGTQVVQQDQEGLMDQAWDWLSKWKSTNTELSRVQFSQQLSNSLYKRNITSLDSGRQLSMTSNIHSRIKADATSKTIFGQFPERAFVEPAFRRLTRFSGSLAKRVGASRRDLVQGGALVEHVLNDPNHIQSVYQNTAIYQMDQQLILTPGMLEENLGELNIDIIQIGLNKGTVFSQSQGKIRQRSRPTRSSARQQRSTASLGAEVMQALDPMISFADRTTKMLKNSKIAVTKSRRRIELLMAAPAFDEPMYEAMAQGHKQVFIPNLDLLPPNTFGLMETNQAFVEAYMAGLNHEFARELFWREFPTDRRGTYFRRFWGNSIGNSLNQDYETDYQSIAPMHRWRNSLGKNRPERLDNQKEDLVFVIRGELLKAYPNTLIYLQKAHIDQDDSNRRKELKGDVSDPNIYKWPIFEAQIEPDIFFFGFDITAEEAMGFDGEHVPSLKEDPGWYIVIEERAGELSFGLDLETPELSEDTNQDQTDGTEEETAAKDWLNLTWKELNIGKDFGGMIDLDEHVPDDPGRPVGDTEETIWWGKGAGKGNAADMAHILYQPAYKIFIHARMMLKKQEDHG